MGEAHDDVVVGVCVCVCRRHRSDSDADVDGRMTVIGLMLTIRRLEFHVFVLGA